MNYRTSAVSFISALIFASIPLAGTAYTVRQILAPLYITNPATSCGPSNCFTYEYNVPTNQFYLTAVGQYPSTNNPPGSPVQYTTAYDAHLNTGLGPLTQTYQRGPLGPNNNSAQSTFQLWEYYGGMLMRSWDSPYANGKHGAYAYSWAIPAYPTSPGPGNEPLLFQLTTNPNDKNDGLVIQSNVTVEQFDAWNIGDNGLPHADDVGQLAFIAYLRDPSGNTLQYVIYLFSENKCDTTKYTCAPQSNGAEGVAFDGNSPYIASSIQTTNNHQTTTTRSDSSGTFSNSTWPGSSPFFRVYITPYNLQQAVAAINAACLGRTPACNSGTLSSDVLHYTLVEVSLSEEVTYANNMDTFVLGSSFYGFGVYEITP